jgi:hypothetical protein
MSRIWIRRLSLLAVAASSGAGVLGIDSLSIYLAHQHTQHNPTGAAQIVTPLAELPTRGAVKNRQLEAHRLQQQRVAAEAQHAVMLKANRLVAATRADRERRLGTPEAARSLGRTMAVAKGWGATQFSCLDTLWTNESGWEIHAQNASGAYGIPQALPGARMAEAGTEWRTDPVTQIRWGLAYISQRHGTPCGALAYWRVHHWY